MYTYLQRLNNMMLTHDAKIYFIQFLCICKYWVETKWQYFNHSFSRNNRSSHPYTFFFTFFYIHKKEVLDSWKFSTPNFRWIYMFWEAMNTIWIFRKCLSVGLYVCPQNFVDIVSQELMDGNWWNFVPSFTLI